MTVRLAFKKQPWYVWYCLLLGVALNGSLFLFLTTTFMEKHKMGVVVTGWTFLFCLTGFICFIRAVRRGKLQGDIPSFIMCYGSVAITLFIAFLFMPFELTGVPPLESSASLVRMEARAQAGSELYAQAEPVMPEEEITLTILDICLGGVQSKAQRDGPVGPEKMDIKDVRALTAYIKSQGKALGAGLVAVTRLDQAHVFTKDHQDRPINLGHTYAIVLATDLPYQLALPSAPLPWKEYYAALPEELAALLADRIPQHGADIVSPEELEKIKETMRFFSEGGRSAVELARLIRSLGYEARAHYSRWSEVQIIPLAQEAGLGELGRNGLLLTKEYGPRASFSVVTTSLPLELDETQDLGLRSFCASCEKCAEACPVKALPLGGPKEERGTVKWVSDGERCYNYLLANPKCLACIGSCPFNKPDYLLHRLAGFMATRNNTVTNNILIFLDDIFGYGDMRPYLPETPVS